MSLRTRLLVTLCLLAPSLFGQAGTGTISGTIADQSGAIIRGAKIVARDASTGFSRETVSNDVGLYSLPGLRPGSYDITVESAGFRKTSQRGFALEVDQIARLDIKLEVGDMTQQVEVTGTVQLLYGDSATLGALIDRAKIGELPLNGRNFEQLALLVPGVNTGQPGASRGAGFSVGGTRSEQNAFQLDGVSNSDQWDNNMFLRPNLDAILEFKIQVNNYSAEFGKGAGGQINVVTRGGTNQFHGSAYEFLRNDAVQARNLFQRDPNFMNKQGKFIAPPFNQNQFGGTFGGPIIKQKTFFFGDYEGFRMRRGQTGIRSIPSAALRQGDFSENLGRQAGTDGAGQPVLANEIFDALTSRLGPGGRYLRDPFPGNKIPSSRFDPVARKILEVGLYPLPNIPGAKDSITGNPIQNYADSRSVSTDSDQFAVRIDQRFSDKDLVFGRYSRLTATTLNPGTLPLQERYDVSNQQLLSVSYNRTLSPTIVNEVRFGYQRSAPKSTSKALQDNINYVQLLGEPGVPTAPAGLIDLGIAGFTSITGSADVVRTNDTFQIMDQFAFNKGRNFFKIGMEVRPIHQFVVNNIARMRSTFSFDNAQWTGQDGFPTSGNTFATFLLGYVRNKGRSLSERRSQIRATEYAGYIQDDFKATSKLTLNLGVRYQLYIPPKEMNDRVSSVRMLNPPGSFRDGGIYVCKDPAKCAAIGSSVLPLQLGLTLNDLRADRLPEIVVAGKQVPRSLVDVEKLDFSPRVGIAYQFDSKTVLRTGYGIFFDTVPMSYFEDSVENIPWTLEDLQNMAPFQFGVPTAETFMGFRNPNPKVTEITPGPNSYSTEFRNAYVQQWNFGIQRQFRNNWVTEISYAGSKGTRLNRREGILPAEPRSANAILPATLNPQLRLLVPFMVYDNQLITISDWYTTTSSAFSTYHALMGRFEKRMSGGLSFINSFAFSKAMSDAQPFSGGDNDTGNRIQDIFNKKADKGLAPYNHKLRFVSSFLYELPFGRGKRFGTNSKAVVNHLIGGWKVNGIATFQSGYPITVLRSGDPLGIATDGAVRPDMVCNPNLPRDQRTVSRYFNPGCFVAPADRFGNAGRSTVTGPGLNSWDMAVFKNFAFAEKIDMQFRSEFFNAFNHPNLGMPGRTVGASGLGVVSSALDPRIIQFGLKLSF